MDTSAVKSQLWQIKTSSHDLQKQRCNCVLCASTSCGFNDSSWLHQWPIPVLLTDCVCVCVTKHLDGVTGIDPGGWMGVALCESFKDILPVSAWKLHESLGRARGCFVSWTPEALIVTPPPLWGFIITGSLPVVRCSCAKSHREMCLCVCQPYLNACFFVHSCQSVWWQSSHLDCWRHAWCSEPRAISCERFTR